MKCSICNAEMSPSGICPVCGNEVNRSNIAMTSESSGGMNSFWVISMEKARNIGGLLNWIGVIIALVGVYLLDRTEKETMGTLLLVVGVGCFLVNSIYAAIKNRCPSCNYYLGFGIRHRVKWERYSGCPKCGKALYGSLADEDKASDW